MIDFKKYLNSIAEKYAIDDPQYSLNMSIFLVSNNWFGDRPVLQDGKIIVEEAFVERIEGRIEEFCAYYNTDRDTKVALLHKKIKEIMPKTAMLLAKYVKDKGLDARVAYHLFDFILYYAPGELHESTDIEISTLMVDGFDNLPKVYGDILADFINWVHRKTRTIYRNEYSMCKYSDNDGKSYAYDPQSYLEILFYLFNAEYIEDNDMYGKAASSKNYVDTWLFLSLHFLSAIRNTDIVRIPHPVIQSAPQDILDRISQGKFTDIEARQVLYSVVWHLDTIRLTPNKTKGTKGVASIKIHIPESMEVHMGMLFAAAEAHFRIKGLDADKPLIRVITDYERIVRYMGEEIGDLFLESNFHCKRANKSYMQMIYLLTDDILGINDEFNVKGYMLAALARSHKSSYGEFAKTTSIYLKDAKMSGYTPEFVAKEMFERGVLSAIPAMLLKMITDGVYDKLSVTNQTKMINALDLSPLEVEQSVGVMQINQQRSIAIVNAVYQNYPKDQILSMLHKIGSGEAVSKCDGCLCLITAMGKVCPYSDNQNCPACEYEISTKTTMFIMASECKRLQELYKSATNPVDKKRYKAMVKNIIIPSIEEMLEQMEELYGREASELLEKIILEVA